MQKKIQALALVIFLGIFLAACHGQGEGNLTKEDPGSQKGQDKEMDSQDNPDSIKDAQEASPYSEDLKDDGEDEDVSEPILGQDATDEDVLDVLKDDINVVTDDNYIEMIRAFTEHTEEYSGQIYQLEGVYTAGDGIPYVTRTAVDGENMSSCGISLRYVPEEPEKPEEGAWIRVTGVINEWEADGETTAALEVVVLQTLDEPGQAELSAN